MATKPTPGGSDGTWDVELNAHLDVGHDADGTHKKSQMLTDMGWSPTAYAGGESVTFPNGLIFKHGIKARTGTLTTITFGTAFPTGVVSCNACESPAIGSDNLMYIATFNKTTLVISEQHSVTNFYWQAWGY